VFEFVGFGKMTGSCYIRALTKIFGVKYLHTLIEKEIINILIFILLNTPRPMENKSECTRQYEQPKPVWSVEKESEGYHYINNGTDTIQVANGGLVSFFIHELNRLSRPVTDDEIDAMFPDMTFEYAIRTIYTAIPVYYSQEWRQKEFTENFNRLQAAKREGAKALRDKLEGTG
jgi:hypothetical protein